MPEVISKPEDMFEPKLPPINLWTMAPAWVFEERRKMLKPRQINSCVSQDVDSPIVAVFDADLVTFKVASACEKRTIKVTHIVSGNVKEFNNRTEFYGRGKAKNGGFLKIANEGRKVPFTVDDFEIEDVQTPEPIENALFAMRRYIEKTMEHLNAGRCEIYLGEGECWRHEILMPADEEADILGRYKGKRDSMRPLHLKAAREYLIKKYNAKVIRDRECDDEVAIISEKGHQLYLETGNKEDNVYVIVSSDKDEGGVNGWWFNDGWMDEPMYVEGFGKLWLDGKKVRGVGRKFKYFQMLAGDKVDNYKASKTPFGSFSYGDKKTYNDIVDLPDDKACWEFMIEKYKEWWPKEIEYRAWNGELTTDDHMSWMQKQYSLVHMQRFEGDHPIVKDILEEYGVKYD